MPRRVPHLLALFLAALLLAQASVAADEGVSLGVTPADLVLQDLLQNETYQRHVTVQNENDFHLNVTVNVSGEVAPWTAVEPAAFRMAPHEHREVNVTFRVPGDAVNGSYSGLVNVVGHTEGDPDGSGQTVNPSVGVGLDLSVGGEAEPGLAWLAPAARDVEAGTRPHVTVDVLNTGNVRVEAPAEVTVRHQHGEDVVARGEVSEVLVPGERRTLVFPLEDPLPLGQYVARVVAGPPGSLDANVTFKVVEPGTLGKDGLLRFIKHEAWVTAGSPVRVDAVFENTGTSTISRAVFSGEVRSKGQLVAVLESQPLVVAVGERVNLTTYVTPDEPGRYVLSGAVTYDGFETETKQSILNVEGDGFGGGWLGDDGPLATLAAWAPVILIVLLLVAYAAYRLHRGDGGDEG